MKNQNKIHALIKKCIFAFTQSLPLFLTSGLLVCVTFSPNELWGQPVQDVSDAENSGDLDNSAKIKWLSENAVSIRSIDPNDDDFADLMPLKNILGSARVVMLGEASHGDGATACAKMRLVRFMHEAMGFDVLAWEESFFSMEEVNRALESGQPLGVGNAWIDRGPWGQYTRATLKTDRPLRHTGVDMLYEGSRASVYQERLFEFITSHLTDLASPADLQTIDEFLRTLQRGDYSASEEESGKLGASIDRVQENLREKASRAENPREFEYFVKTLEDLAAQEQRLVLGTRSPFPFPQNILFRSRKMGENLIWLAKEWYPEQKIIVSAANRHVARNVSSIKILRPETYTVAVQFPPEYREMGDIIYKELGQSVYGIAFVAYQGTRGRQEYETQSIKPIPGSIESLWHATGHYYSFLDFRSLRREHWLHEPQLAHVDGGAIERSVWTDVFDGIFYIDTMFPKTESGTVPEGVHTER